MRSRNFIWLFLVAVVLTACQRYLIPHTEGQALNITIEFPVVSSGESKANVGEVPATEAENVIKDLSIWVFETQETESVSGKHVLVAQFSTNKSSELPSAGGVRKYSLSVTRDFALHKPHVDVFVLVNKGSINTTLNDDSNWAQLNAAIFGGDAYFSPVSPISSQFVKTTNPDFKGLPMSGVGKDLSIEGEEPYFSIPTVSVGRAVSKLRYLFCQMYTENNTEEVFKIEQIVLDGYQIPQQEYVFSENACHIVPSYVSTAMETDCSQVELKSNDRPELYSYAGQDGPSYQRLMDEAITANKISDLGTFYMRESDKALTGTVYYSITKTGEETQYKHMPFTMDAPGDFARNHTWTLYGYFISNRTLQLGISVLPWDKNNYSIEFSTSTLQVTQKFTVDNKSADIKPSGIKDHYNVFLDYNKAAKGYLYVTTPQGGRLEIIPEGTTADLEAFLVTPSEATIDPSHNSGRIDIAIERNPDYQGDPTGRTITLTFKAFTPDGDREIWGATECVDQIYHFYL